ncbi:hypothetical protein, partial [Snodgrassella communis]|uniref:hypothetical protein n=1 Tax=Snodgrassella communis TaxID=2946699 RepID=UPI001EF4D48E
RRPHQSPANHGRPWPRLHRLQRRQKHPRCQPNQNRKRHRLQKQQKPARQQLPPVTGKPTYRRWQHQPHQP